MFLTLVQGLETYDRRTTSLEARGRDGCHCGRREPTLRMRLDRIVSEAAIVGERICGDKEAFVSAVVDGRNYYTHYDERLERRAPKGIRLVPLTAQLKALTEACLLGEVGFSSEEINVMFDRIDRYAHIEHLQNVVAEHGED